MKAVIKNGMLVDEQGFELYPNRVYQYGSAFRKVIEDYPEGTEVEIKNCWNASTLYSDNARILYGSCLDFSFTEPSNDSIEQTVIKESDDTLTTEGEVDEDGITGDTVSDIASGISDSIMSDSVQNESDNAQRVQGCDS